MKYIGKCSLEICTRVTGDYCCCYCADRNKCNTKCDWLDNHDDYVDCKYFYTGKEDADKIKMKKSIMVFDTPNNCIYCQMLNDNDECILQSNEENSEAKSFRQLKEQCPLSAVPDRKI